ncbi:PLP-dependent transferase [Zopfia rhizophila CBS 207.26]|uniref:PLP-dependent transferase n=1 Tax=Zopfia rhizophila CBS 207.26 TaxID=1314779 RepID=A0A6A6ETB5_9PEZI|nr:PLP-dependent transferase [Zopfia rhizophila CBS 207.26]
MTAPEVIDEDNGVVQWKANHTNGATKSAVLHRDIHHEPPKITRALGIYLHLNNGQKLLDAVGGAAVACLGQPNTRVIDAVVRQLSEVSYCHSGSFGTCSGEALARELVNSTGGEMAKAFIVSSGSEATEAVIKFARQYFIELSPPQPARTKFIAREQSYHGTTLGALSLGSHLARREKFEPILLQNASHVSACNAYRFQHPDESTEDYVARLAGELDEAFKRVGPETVCAFVAEPVSGAALGCVPAVPGYFKAMKKVCDKYGALLIFDEIMCGMGRTGTLHAWEQEGVVPDIQTIGKGLGGGFYPVAGFLVGQRVINALARGTGAFAHGQTYQGHPGACAAALEVQRIIREEGLLDNVRKMGALMSSLLKQKLETHPYVGDIRGKGLFWGIEFVRDKATKQPFHPALSIASRVHEKAFRPPYNISIYPGAGTVDGESGDHILLAPAYNVSEAEIELIVDRTVRAIEDFFADF